MAVFFVIILNINKKILIPRLEVQDMIIPEILGKPLHLWLGLLLFVLIVFQILIAKKIIPIFFDAPNHGIRYSSDSNRSWSYWDRTTLGIFTF